APWQVPQQGRPQSPPAQEKQPNNEGIMVPHNRRNVNKPEHPAAQSVSHSRDVIHMAPDLDIISSDSTDSVKEQLRQVNQRLDQVQREFVKSKEEHGESSKGGSPFVPEIQNKLVLANFRPPLLESYDDNSDPSEYVAAFELGWPSTTPRMLYCHKKEKKVELICYNFKCSLGQKPNGTGWGSRTGEEVVAVLSKVASILGKLLGKCGYH
ncbi:hypothetical protein B296_00043744, partial [Ensete ventricosum]